MRSRGVSESQLETGSPRPMIGQFNGFFLFSSEEYLYMSFSLHWFVFVYFHHYHDALFSKSKKSLTNHNSSVLCKFKTTNKVFSLFAFVTNVSDGSQGC